MAPTNQPSTRPTDCVEHEFIAYGELSELIGCQVCGRHPDDIISDLEAQLAAAREAIHEAKTKLEAIPSIDWNGITPFNGVWNVLHKADYATPPSPEVTR